MDTPHGCRPLRPCLLHHPHHHFLHHHHHYPLFLCPRHRHHHHHHHHHHCIPFNFPHHLPPNFTSFPQNPEPAAAVPLPTGSNLETSGYTELYDPTPTPQVLQEQTQGVLEEEEDDDDPVFVLTDEWKEFFAKSEAKRKLEKQARKQAKKQQS